MGDVRPLWLSARTRARSARQTLSVGAALAVAAALTAAGAATAAPARLRGSGTATLVSVDGPARLTIKTKRGQKLPIRLFFVDAPQVGECGAAESTAALTKLAKRGKRRLRYELIERGSGFERDATGRYVGQVAGPGQDVFFSGLGVALVDAGWARSGDPLALGQGPVSHGDFQVGGAGAGGGPPTTPRGLWATCGGRAHLPLGQPVPAHAPATWAVNADGLTESIGPLRLSPTMSPSTNLTIAQVAAVAPVEVQDVGQSQCRAAVPSLEIVLSAEMQARQSCGQAEVYAVVTSGPGAAATTRGVGVGTPASAARAAFPRSAAGADDDDALRLAGADQQPWAWQTQAGVDENGKLSTLYTSAGPAFD